MKTKWMIVLLILLTLAGTAACAEECRLTEIPWDRLNGDFQVEAGSIVFRDGKENPAGKSYVYYDTDKAGDIAFTVQLDELVLSERAEFIVRIEGKTDDANAVELCFQQGQLAFRAYDGRRKASCEEILDLAAGASGALTLSFSAESGMAQAYWQARCIGTWQMKDFIVPHRVRMTLNDKSDNGTSSAVLSKTDLTYSTQEVTKMEIPAVLTLKNDLFHLELDTARHGLTVLKRVNDKYDTNYARTEDPELLGNVTLRYATPEHLAAGEYREILSRRCDVMYEWTDTEIKLIYRDMLSRGVTMVETWKLVDDELLWEMQLTNVGQQELRIGDLQLHFAFNQAYVKDTTITYTQRLVRHGLCSLDGSFYYWTRPNGEGPMLTMVPAAGTALEYHSTDWSKKSSGWEGPFSMYIHSEASGKATEGDWILPHTGLTLAPNENKTYALRFAWAAEEENLRDTIVKLGGVDVTVLPGMTVTKEMPVKLALRSEDVIHEVKPCEGATVTAIGEKDGYLLYDVSFTQIGENRLEVVFGDQRQMMLDFFVTRPLDDLIQSRAEHIVEHQQYRGDEWYNGVFSQWDMRTQELLTPANVPEGLYRYIVGGGDDPGLCKAPFLATKNLAYPDQEEIAAIEYYIEHFVWGGLQRTDEETPRPYAIYGTDYWYEQRNSGTGFNTGGHGEDKMWRTFDYTHICQLYYYMYRIATLYPDMVSYLDADGYLERAYGTAMAFYKVPISIFMDHWWAIQGYSDWAYKQGNFHEMVIPSIVDALEAEGRTEQAATLRAEWEMKVKYMVYDHPYPFGSEMWFDSTAFESTHAVAKYGMEHDVQTDTTGFYDPNANGPGQGAYLEPHDEIKKEDFMNFMEKELSANKAARAIIEPAYYLLGSDFRQDGGSSYTLSYMTQLGGWSLVDAALYYSDTPAEDMRLAYASYLAGWSLIHTGEDYPWYPGEDNEGAAAWAYEPSKVGNPWIGQRFFEQRGPWVMDGEIDNGFSGGLRTSASVLVDDPLFGLYLYGGSFEKTEAGLLLKPADGLQQRLHLLNGEQKVHLKLDRDGIVTALVTAEEIVLSLENRTGDSHEVSIELQLEDKQTITFQAPAEDTYEIRIALK